jgi:hypothetical protein
MKRLILLCIGFALAQQLNACINIYAIDSSGKTHFVEHFFFSRISFNPKGVAAQVKQLNRQFKKGQFSHENISDYGAYLLMAGHVEEGLQLYRALIYKMPNVYEIQANLAVAYELNGNIDSAIYWQQKAVVTNPGAHNNSEWIHLKILEARKNMQTDAGWCLHNSVSQVALNDTNATKDDLIMRRERFYKSMIEQLNDRLPFALGNDPVMGKLLFELGEAYLPASMYRAYYCYALAQYLYPALQNKCNQKMEWIRSRYPATNNGLTDELRNKYIPRDKDRELMRPDDAEVQKFINRLIDRPALRNDNLVLFPLNTLLQKI